MILEVEWCCILTYSVKFNILLMYGIRWLLQSFAHLFCGLTSPKSNYEYFYWEGTTFWLQKDNLLTLCAVIGSAKNPIFARVLKTTAETRGRSAAPRSAIGRRQPSIDAKPLCSFINSSGLPDRLKEEIDCIRNHTFLGTNWPPERSRIERNWVESNKLELTTQKF